MTNAEAIEILRDMGGCCSSDNEYIACNMAISALEKQEGKEPIAVSTGTRWPQIPNFGNQSSGRNYVNQKNLKKIQKTY